MTGAGQSRESPADRGCRGLSGFAMPDKPWETLEKYDTGVCSGAARSRLSSFCESGGPSLWLVEVRPGDPNAAPARELANEVLPVLLGHHHVAAVCPSRSSADILDLAVELDRRRRTPAKRSRAERRRCRARPESRTGNPGLADAVASRGTGSASHPPTHNVVRPTSASAVVLRLCGQQAIALVALWRSSMRGFASVPQPLAKQTACSRSVTVGSSRARRVALTTATPCLVTHVPVQKHASVLDDSGLAATAAPVGPRAVDGSRVEIPERQVPHRRPGDVGQRQLALGLGDHRSCCDLVPAAGVSGCPSRGIDVRAATRPSPCAALHHVRDGLVGPALRDQAAPQHDVRVCRGSSDVSLDLSWRAGCPVRPCPRHRWTGICG